MNDEPVLEGACANISGQKRGRQIVFVVFAAAFSTIFQKAKKIFLIQKTDAMQKTNKLWDWLLFVVWHNQQRYVNIQQCI